MAFNKLLIAVDDSEFSLTAARKGIELAQQLNAQLALVYVIDDALTTANLDGGIVPEEWNRLMTIEAERTFANIEELYTGGKEVMKFIPKGTPREEILNMAEAFEADMIVMGTHGHTGLQHLLIGSTAEWTVRHSTIPVLVVKIKE